MGDEVESGGEREEKKGVRRVRGDGRGSYFCSCSNLYSSLSLYSLGYNEI